MMNDNSIRVMEIDVNEILPNRFQPRIKFDEEQIMELSDSIKEHGVIQPITVRSVGDKYEIIDGERRYKANILAGRKTIPIIVKNLNDKDSAEVALIGNVQRKNLSPIEEALSYKKILDMGYTTQEELATKIGKSQSTIANKIRLLNLSDEVQEALLDNKISERHARSLLRLPTPKLQNEMLNKVVKERLTVRRTDEEIDKLKNLNESLDKIEIKSEEDKKEEKEMNNTINSNIIPNITQEPQPELQPINNEVMNQSVMQEQPQMVAPSFDVFAQPQQMEQSVQPSMPTVEATVMPQAVEQPQMASEVQITPMEAMPQMAPMDVQMPATAPIVEQPMETIPVQNPVPEVAPAMDINNQANGTMVQDPNPIPEFQMPEPIIITDYNKEYDPVMPQAVEQPQQQMSINEVINAIRECANKIEAYGFKMDVEEYDLTNIYQVIFKIQK